jgi:hypothetical protein
MTAAVTSADVRLLGYGEAQKQKDAVFCFVTSTYRHYQNHHYSTAINHHRYYP